MGQISKSSRNVLNRRHLEHFTGDTLFDAIARAVCEAECLPRKELYEAWETARRVRRQMRGGLQCRGAQAQAFGGAYGR